MLRSSSYPFLPNNRGEQRQQVAPVRDWRSDCLEKQGEPVVEICGVLGRLHSVQGLAQSNNNAKLNNSAKHVTMLLETECKDGKDMLEKLPGVGMPS